MVDVVFGGEAGDELCFVSIDVRFEVVGYADVESAALVGCDVDVVLFHRSIVR